MSKTFCILSTREVATIRAALLFWREENSSHGRSIVRPYFRAIGAARTTPLNAAEITALSRRLRAKRK